MDSQPSPQVPQRVTSAAASSPDARYVFAVAAGAVIGAIGLLSVLQALRATGNLPPPAFANSLCVDEKLTFLRDHMPPNPTLLVAGSSVAWRHIDSRALAALPGMQPLNGGFCGLSVSQSVVVTHWMLDHFSTIRRVLMLVSPHDFTRCTASPPFNLADAKRFVFDHHPAWSFYLRYFDPVSLIRNSTRVARQRSNLTPFDPLVFTEYGDGPLQTEATAELSYGPVYHMDDLCFGALHGLALHLQRARIEFVLVKSPINPVWKALHDADQRVEIEFEDKVRRALDGTHAIFWNGDTRAFQSHEFVDAVHLRWPAAQRFSEQMIHELRSRSAL